ncbi:uncharacterized protein A1O9_00759 [Exophiala aquamarina CBS 119918]|uniref:U3 small nucleolar RNA-associated protein 13 C-terminal domain-containing protein n=1 Tax=Exophiala aquamarina CBS 119918 TaxID=1182545 RepID=A0A072PSG9_9EURO|nr:uncharacterized protein A1O9_00759 [Exophiala aquamarina CBS 119918]KEF62786.1 hypothetical protein A1O9_00759 [Exophiala aquamarina CBS 119918]
MATKVSFKTTFEAAKTIQPIYTGGEISGNLDGTLIATCVDEDVLVVRSETAIVLCRVEGDGDPVTSLCLAPDSSHLVVCSRSLSLRIYTLTKSADSDLFTSSLARTLKPHNTPVVSSAIDVTSSLLATGGADGSVKVWDIRGGYASHTFHGHGGVISALTFFERKSRTIASRAGTDSTRKRKLRGGERNDPESPTCNSICLASGSEDGNIRIWDLASRKSIALLDSHVSVVRSIRFSAGQDILLSASRDRTIILWNSENWKQQRVIPALEALETGGLLDNGQLCYAGGENGVLRIWSTGTGREITPKQKAKLENDSILSIIQISKSEQLLSVHQDQTLRLHDISPLQNLQDTTLTEVPPVIRTVSGNYDEIIDMACVGPDRSLLALATNTESIKLISTMDSIDPEASLLVPPSFGSEVALLEGHEDIIICLDVDWSGHWLATGAKDNTARLWRLDPASSSYECFAVFAGHAESLGAIALPRTQPSDSLAMKNPANHPPEFLLTGSQDKTIKRWDMSKLKYSPTMNEPHRGIKALFTRVAHEKDINAIASSPIAPLFASASQDRTIKIWSLEDGSVAGILRGHKRGVWSIQFSPISTAPLNLPEGGTSGSRGLLVSGSGDRTIKVWSLSTYTCLQTFEGHSNSVLKVIWLPPRAPSRDKEAQSDANQPLIASASSDTLVKIWSPYSSAESDHLLATLDNHSDRVWALTSPSSCISQPSQVKMQSPTNAISYPLISGAADASLTFWADTTVQTANLASKRATERIEQDQLLQNHIFTKNYREAIVLSLALNHPGRLLRIFQDVVSLPDSEKDRSSIMGVQAVDDVLAALDHQQLFSLLERVRDWNTNARTATVAQTILNCLFKKYPASAFVDMAKERKFGDVDKGMKEILRALEVYTERHYRRMEELVDESYLIDYTLREMDEIAGTILTVDGHESQDVVMT